MEKDQFQYLLQKYFSGDISEKEQNDLDELLKNESYAETFRSYARLNRRIAGWSYTSSSEDRKEKILNEIMGRSRTKRKMYTIPAFIKYAAVLVVLLGLGAIIVVDRLPPQAGEQLIIEDNTITLHLSDTLIKSLTGKRHGMISSLEDVRVEQSGDTIQYTTTGNKAMDTYNEIDVPHGKTAVLILSDGSRVTLNAGTWLKFPRNVAATTTREVYIKGEAYFDVARDTSRPFVVHANDVDVRVLGTHFNVNNYESGATVNTVLVEGKVALYNGSESYDKENSLVIHPGTLAEFDKSGRYISTKTVDTSLYTSWRSGALIFEGTDFSSIIHSLERKFNVKIENHNSKLEKEIFTAKFKEEPIQKVLESFQQSYPFEYTIKENKIIIN